MNDVNELYDAVISYVKEIATDEITARAQEFVDCFNERVSKTAFDLQSTKSTLVTSDQMKKQSVLNCSNLIRAEIVQGTDGENIVASVQVKVAENESMFDDDDLLWDIAESIFEDAQKIYFSRGDDGDNVD